MLFQNNGGFTLPENGIIANGGMTAHGLTLALPHLISSNNLGGETTTTTILSGINPYQVQVGPIHGDDATTSIRYVGEAANLRPTVIRSAVEEEVHGGLTLAQLENAPPGTTSTLSTIIGERRCLSSSAEALLLPHSSHHHFNPSSPLLQFPSQPPLPLPLSLPGCGGGSGIVHLAQASPPLQPAPPRRAPTTACVACGGAIFDRFFCLVGDASWHEECCRCVVCQRALAYLGQSTCYYREGALYCRSDYFMKFAPILGAPPTGVQAAGGGDASGDPKLKSVEESCCARCGELIEFGEAMMKAGRPRELAEVNDARKEDAVGGGRLLAANAENEVTAPTRGQALFHLRCFTCSLCGRALRSGELYRMGREGEPGGALFCQAHLPSNICQPSHFYQPMQAALPANGMESQQQATTLRVLTGRINRDTEPNVTSRRRSYRHASTNGCFDDAECRDENELLKKTTSTTITTTTTGSISVTANMMLGGTGANGGGSLHSLQPLVVVAPAGSPGPPMGMCGGGSGGYTSPEGIGNGGGSSGSGANDSGSNGKGKRMRTSFKHHQLRTMKTYFSLNHNPDAKDLKQLAQKTGLTKRVLQVWFQNARAKFRRASHHHHHNQQQHAQHSYQPQHPTQPFKQQNDCDHGVSGEDDEGVNVC